MTDPLNLPTDRLPRLDEMPPDVLRLFVVELFRMLPFDLCAVDRAAINAIARINDVRRAKLHADSQAALKRRDFATSERLWQEWEKLTADTEALYKLPGYKHREDFLGKEK